MADAVKLTIVQVREDDRWRAAAVIDGRRYPDRQSFDRVVDEAFETMAKYHIPAQFETRAVLPTAPPSPLPSWEDYRVMLASKGARGTA
jgi:hypothetical protein